VRYSIKYR